jgi:uncharacterized membrane protein YfcA
MEVAGQIVSLPLLALLGIAVGLAAGMFGVGGGFLLTPLLAVLFDIPMPIAVGTGLCQMVGTAVAALLRHRRIGQGEIRFDLVMVAGAIVGVAAGVRSVSELEQAGDMAIGGGRLPVVTVVLYSAYVVLLVGCSWLFWRQGNSRMEALDEALPGPLSRLNFGPAIDLPKARLRGVSVWVIAYIGLGLGFLSGLLGIGGGVALMPVLIYGFGMPIRQAAGTGILVLLVSVTVGTVQHALAGHVHLGMACVLLVGSTISAQVGALLTRRLPSRTLRRIFSLLIWVTIVAIAWDVLNRVR